MTSRSLRSITFRYEDCISSLLLVAQEPPRSTPQSRLLPFVPTLYVSRHHSQTFPPRSYYPNEFGLKLPTGIVAPRRRPVAAEQFAVPLGGGHCFPQGNSF